MDYLYILILIALQITFFIQLYYTLVIHQKLAGYRITDREIRTSGGVSVVICARNELDNLKNNLGLFFEQDHPEFEIVVVNDCSVDGTDWYLRELAEQHSNLKVATLTDHPRFKHGKKFAVTIGIKAAKYDNLVFSDADCRPVSPQWLSKMAANFSEETDIILGYSPYEYRGGLLNRFIRFETFVTALNYFSFALAGKPYMGVGRNLGYKKGTFFKGKGFASHMHVPSGDDDLFVNQNATPENTAIELHPDSHVWSTPKTTYGSYFSQKIRHQGAGRHYQKQHKRMLGMLAGSGTLFYLLLFALIAIQAQWWLILTIYVIRLGVQLIVYVPALRKLRYPDLVWWLPLLDMIYYIYIVVLSFVALFRKRVEWK